MKVLVGTSGWHYKHWLGVFYPTGTRPAEMFKFYARYFNTVEINNSFYRLPAAETFDAWRESSPSNFCFALKASRFITHMKKLKEPRSSSEKFFLVTQRLQQKLGPILFQLPPQWNVNVERLAEFSRRSRESTRTRLSFVMRVGLSRRCLSCCANLTWRTAFTILQR